ADPGAPGRPDTKEVAVVARPARARFRHPERAVAREGREVGRNELAAPDGIEQGLRGAVRGDAHEPARAGVADDAVAGAVEREAEQESAWPACDLDGAARRI